MWSLILLVGKCIDIVETELKKTIISIFIIINTQIHYDEPKETIL